MPAGLNLHWDFRVQGYGGYDRAIASEHVSEDLPVTAVLVRVPALGGFTVPVRLPKSPFDARPRAAEHTADSDKVTKNRKLMLHKPMSVSLVGHLGYTYSIIIFYIIRLTG